MSIEAALWAYLLEDAGVIAALGDQVYREMAPTERAQEFPYITVTQSGEQPVHSLQGFTGLTNNRLVLELWCTTAAQRDTLAALLQPLVNAAGGYEAEAVVVRQVMVTDQSDTFIPPSDGSERGVYQRTLDLDVWYRDIP